MVFISACVGTKLHIPVSLAMDHVKRQAHDLKDNDSLKLFNFKKVASIAIKRNSNIFDGCQMT